MTKVPFFRPDVSDNEIDEVVDTLRSGWLTTGPKVHRFENEFAEAVKAPHAVAANSCTAALHLAVEALGLEAGQAVIVPTMTFAATAEIVRYMGAYPLLVDCEEGTLNLDLDDARRKMQALRSGALSGIPADAKVVGLIPVHVGGLMADIAAIQSFAAEHGLWIVEDAAHAFPAAWRPGPSAPWQRCGDGTAAISCFSFYANKTITTGEGGMATTADGALADRMRIMSLHGLSQDAWRRYSGGGGWDYRILAPGFKYNLTDVAAAIGIHQLRKAEAMRGRRESVARRYTEAFAHLDEIETPADDADRLHSWHLYPIRLRLDRLAIGRNAFMEELKSAGIGCSVHWRPLHLHPYYQETFGWRPEQFPTASMQWERLISLPIFPSMQEAEVSAVADRVRSIGAAHRASSPQAKKVSLNARVRDVREPSDSLAGGLPRAAEVLLAATGLVLAAPILVLSAAAIAVSSKGSILFRQKRVGRGGEPFVLVKLRTMRASRGLGVTARDDPRVTRVGRILRRTKLDELPELWNVLRGDLSLVGPRPEVPEFVDLESPAWQEVLRVRPGLTDPVTLRLRDEESLMASVPGDRARYYREVLQPQKLRGYADYLRRRSWHSDLRVLLDTGLAVVCPPLARKLQSPVSLPERPVGS